MFQLCWKEFSTAKFQTILTHQKLFNINLKTKMCGSIESKNARHCMLLMKNRISQTFYARLTKLNGTKNEIFSYFRYLQTFCFVAVEC